MEISKLNEAIARLNFYESPGIAYTLEQKYILENKIKELEKENRRLIEDKGKVEVELSITSDRFSELKQKHDYAKNEITNTKNKYSEEISLLEKRIAEIKENYDVIRIEHKSVKTNEDKYKHELLVTRMEKEALEDKFLASRSKNDELSKRIQDMDFQIKSLLLEKEMCYNERQRMEEERRMKNEMKAQCIAQMKSNIHSYRNELMRSRSKK